MNELVRNFVQISPFRPSIDFRAIEDPEERMRILQDYVITDSIQKNLHAFLESVADVRRGGSRNFIVAGGYGTGKSYFLIFTSLLAESLSNPNLLVAIRSKLKGNKTLLQRLERLVEKDLRVLPVRIDLKGQRTIKSIAEIFVSAIKMAWMEHLGKELELPFEYDDLLTRIRTRMSGQYRQRIDQALRERGGLAQVEDMLERRLYEGIRVFSQAFQHEFGFPPEIAVPSVDEIVSQVLGALKKDFHGICVFVDELQKFLESSPKVADDMRTLEALYEATDGKPMMLVTSILERQVAAEKDWSQDYDKFVSRFEPISLSLEGLDDIIRSKLVLDKETKARLKQNETTSLLGDNLSVLLQLYPLNPTTFRLLRRVAELRAADRSAFSFLRHAYEEIMDKPFIGSNNKPTLITPDQLYEHFEPDLENKFKEVVNEVRALVKICRAEEKPYIHHMGIATVIEGQFQRADLSQGFLDKDEVASRFMTRIIATNPSIFPVIVPDQIYSIKPIAGAVEATILEFEERIGDPFERLVATLNESNKSFTTCTVDGAQRRISVEFVLLDKVSAVLNQPLNAEIRLLIILPVTKIDLKDVEVHALIESAGGSDVLVFVLEQTIQDIQALKRFFASKLAVDEDRLLKDEVQAILSNTTILFKQLFASSNASVWHQKKKITKQADLIAVDSLTLEKDFLDQILEQAFKRMYPIYWELKRKCKPDVDLTSRKQTNAIIRDFFSSGRIIADTEKSSTARYVENLAQGFGFVYKRGGEFYLGLPGAGIQKVRFDEILNRISVSNRLVDLYHFLHGEWGFPEPLIDLYLAALIGLRKIILLDTDKNPKRFDLRKPDEIKKIIEDAKKGVEWYLHPPRVLAKDKWSLVKEFLKGIGFDEPRFLDQETLTEDQIFELSQIMTAALTNYREKLNNVQKFLETYEIELSRIEMKFGSGVKEHGKR